MPNNLRREVNPDRHTRHEILLEPEVGHKEAVYHVFGFQNQLNGSVRRNGDGRRYYVVLGRRILGIETERISIRVAHLKRIKLAECVVRAGVAEVPGELLGGHLNRERIRRSFVKVQARPNLLAEYSKSHKDRGGYGRPRHFELVATVGVSSVALPAAAELKDHKAQCDLRQHEHDRHNDKREHELVVHQLSVLGDRRRKPPFVNRKHRHCRDRNDPKQQTESFAHIVSSTHNRFSTIKPKRAGRYKTDASNSRRACHFVLTTAARTL